MFSWHSKYQSEIPIHWLVPGDQMNIYIYIWAYVCVYVYVCKYYIYITWFNMILKYIMIYFDIWCKVYIMFTSMCYLSLEPTPWPKEFTPRYHQLHRVAARQRNFDRRWTAQFHPLSNRMTTYSNGMYLGNTMILWLIWKLSYNAQKSGFRW